MATIRMCVFGCSSFSFPNVLGQEKKKGKSIIYLVNLAISWKKAVLYGVVFCLINYSLELSSQFSHIKSLDKAHTVEKLKEIRHFIGHPLELFNYHILLLSN